MSWKNNFAEGKELVVATASGDGAPNANIVISLGFFDDKLLIANCQMNTTINNLVENSRICVIGGYFRVNGTVEIFSSGKYFNATQKDEEYPAKQAILIKINEVFDLDKSKLVE